MNLSPLTDRLLNHIWDIHSIEKSFMQKCQISNCLEMFKSLKSFRQDVEKSH